MPQNDSPKQSPRWVKGLRSSCPRGWSVREHRDKIRLEVRAGAGGSKGRASVTLPLIWDASSQLEAIALILELKQAVDAGRDLRDALAQHQLLATVAASPTSGSDWQDLVDAFRVDLTTNGNEIKDTTWRSSYELPLDRMVVLMSGSKAPTDARELTAAVAAHWKGKPRARELAVNAVKGCLAFGVETRRLPAATWTLGERTAKALKGRKATKRTVACPSDAELLQLIDSISNEAWRNVLRLLALYGLRPEELNHLQIRQHPDTAKPAVWCSFRKTCGSAKTEPRWLMPLPLVDAFGEPVQWNLAGAMAAGLLELPPLSDKYALRTFLMRQKGWLALKDDYDAAGEWLRPGYSFRNAYSLRGHRAGHRLDVLCLAMGHSPTTHQANYEWSRDSSVLEHIS